MRGGGFFNFFLVTVWRQSCDKSTVKLSTTVAFCDMSTVDILTVYLSTVYFSTSPHQQLIFQKDSKTRGARISTTKRKNISSSPLWSTWLWRTKGARNYQKEENQWFKTRRPKLDTGKVEIQKVFGLREILSTKYGEGLEHLRGWGVTVSELGPNVGGLG